MVRLEDGAVVVLAGQSHDTATAYSADVLARQARIEGVPEPLAAVLRSGSTGCRQMDPATVVFAHDHAVWQP